ncbi:MAG: carbonic anhydrase, partial [Flavisolibacter sp.]
GSLRIKSFTMGKIQTIIAVAFGCYFSSCQSKTAKTEAPHTDTLIAASSDSHIDHDSYHTPYEVLSGLKDGNARFVRALSPSNMSHDSSYSYFDQIAHTRNEQHPIACILTCMDSRVPPEIIFDQGIGSLFIVRVAGNIEDPDVLGSMEYAVAEKGVTVVVVMGHKNCGAIHAAFDKLNPENRQLVSLIEHVRADIVPNDQPPYDASAKHNVKLTIKNILDGSKTIREKVLKGDVILVGALYDVSNGTIDWNTEGW